MYAQNVNSITKNHRSEQFVVVIVYKSLDAYDTV